MEKTFGIDFGTSNSALSLNRDGEVGIVGIDPFNVSGRTMRSVLFFDEEGGVFCGQEAIDQYILNAGYGRFMQSIKAFLPSRSFDYTYIDGKRYSLEDLVAILLRKIKSNGEEYSGSPVESVVLGRPVVFSEEKELDLLAQSRLEEAAKKAGFRNIAFQYEPIAAALAYEATMVPGDEKIVLIGDFGGGTSDFTVIRLHGGLKGAGAERKNDILSLGGVYIGGDTFDSAIMWEKIAKYFGRGLQYYDPDYGGGRMVDMPPYIIRTLCKWHLIPQLRDGRTMDHIGRIRHLSKDAPVILNLEHLIGDNYGFRLFRSIEAAKCELSSLELSRVSFKERGLRVDEPVARREFEGFIAEDVKRIADCVSRTVADAGISDGQIGSVFITGGSSYIPCIRRIFSERFGSDRICEMNAFTSVAYGLGLSASMTFV